VGWLEKASQRLQEATGVTLADPAELEAERTIKEAVTTELRATRKDLDLLGWSALDYISGQPADVPVQTRRELAAHARRVWRRDPMAGAAVDLLNDFTFSRGVPAPRARDEEVQVVIDEAWQDVDNVATLTSYAAQVALGTDLSLQSNLFLGVFDDGDDGKVKLTVVPHDSVIDVVRDPDNPMRILYYVVEVNDVAWDFDADQPVSQATGGASSGRGGYYRPGAGGKPSGERKVLYFEHWLNCRALREQNISFPEPPPEKQAAGKMYHIATNRGSEMAFGVPRMERTLRWLTGYNEIVAARVDMAKAAAAFIMKRRITGTKGQVERLAAQAISRKSELGQAAVAGTGTQIPPAPGSILNENEAVQHEPLKLDSGSSGAMQDAQMIRAQVSAATRWPQHYLGDVGASSLAGATAIELPVLKLVEANQELFENLFRAFIDRVIERAVEVGRLDRALPEDVERNETETVQEAAGGAEADAQDEADTERDLSYEFKMPSPMRRMMTDLVSSVQMVATTFDPNNSNLELSRTLLTIVLGEAFEMQDPAEAVDRIFPEGYVDPAVAAAQAQAQIPGTEQPDQLGPGNEGAPTGGDGQDQAQNPYGAPTQSPAPEQRRGSGPYSQQEAADSIEEALLADPVFREAWAAAVGVERRNGDH
jgi:hypothetical protein